MILDAPHLAERYFDQDMVEAQERLIAGGAALVFSSRCPGKEAPNEDAAALIPFNAKSAILVVAGGMGGSQAGERAASILSGRRCRGDNRASSKEDI